MIDVSKSFLEAIGSSLKDDDNKDPSPGLGAVPYSIKRNIFTIEGAVSNEELYEFFEFFSDPDNRDLLKVLPHYEEVIEAMEKANETGWKDYNKRMELINELNPYSAFLTIVKRQDLGEEANQLFRKE